jgi:hypothetical protein
MYYCASFFLGNITEILLSYAQLFNTEFSVFNVC